MPPHTISPLQLQATADFFNRLYNQFTHLFLDPKGDFYKSVQARLSPISENLTFENLLDIQRLIFKNMELHNQKDWYPIFHCVYVQSQRTSAFSRQLFAALLAECQVVIGRWHFDHVLVPGCGKFFEAEDVCRLLRPVRMDALDIDYQDIEFSRAMAPDLAAVQWRYCDLTQPLDRNYDLALLLHPQVCDYDRLWASPIYKRYGDEFMVPAADLQRAATYKFIPPAWLAILDNCFAALKPEGHAIFMCYEHRELAMIQSYLENKPQLKIVYADVNTLTVDPAFSADMLACLNGPQQPSAEFVAMGAYRAVMVVSKQ